MKLATAAVAAVAFVLGVRVYRQRQELRIVALSVQRAERLVRADTWLGYHEAATLLGLRAAEVDRAGAGSLRAVALAMLALDYRDEEAGSAALALVAAAEAAGNATERMHLAAAALAIREGRAGTAVEQLAQAGDDPLRGVLTARVALLAGNAPGAHEPLGRALGADARMPAALSMRGDLLRRAGRTTDARDLYAAALKESGEVLAAGLGTSPAAGLAAPHARSAFGLAKLALSRDVPAAEATAALEPVVARADGTPIVERIRAGMYLSALQARLGQRASSVTTLQAVPVDRDLRGWVERTTGQLESSKERYRVPDATPPALVSASDDDPYVPPPHPPAKMEGPPRPKLYGFKVHGPASAAPKKPARTASKGVPKKSPKKSGKRSATRPPQQAR